MASSLTLRSSRCAAAATRTSRRVARARTIVFAEEPRFTLDNSSKAAEGFVEKDTAGQSNMYPTVMKPVEVGSANDTVQQESFNNGLAVGTSVVALLAIGAGLTALVGANPQAPAAGDMEDFSKYKSLTYYSKAFSAQANPAPPVAAVAEVAPAPVAAVAEAIPEPSA